ncbi:hypothetical protein TBLA_0B05520 [Henningerozyma blattae CBS 6284]|uniref:CRAL-TRIO domain-containing protein n=1 Tax=Henningerozyma blattae (strain ATCC 34711 / CBS 6284 / DSM 70876 / NBRC 10599 / NRRL Y-10934 / UCD 77-7) TaxID=1071380 RepID=I2GZ28_HENB6|nr:hypothetical protein TBLA_0B05520 [Tetrapisispora blattae CBS 6284]CCH59380.1 hypothetical protein TBLA_0B05520 [Tetrapisispora blattae CBS 6284]
MSTKSTKSASASSAVQSSSASITNKSIKSSKSTSSNLQEKEFLESYPQTCKPGDTPGSPGNTTDAQLKTLKEFRSILKKKGYTERLDDATLLRFLRARKFDLALAEKMFVDCENWRKEFGTNTILEDFHYDEKPIVAKYYPQYYHKTDKDGRPCYFEELGMVNLPDMLKITTQERMLKNLVWEYEAFVKYRLPASSRAVGYLVETSCTIMDLKGISISSAYNVISYVKEASIIGQNYYPERMGKFYLINAPFGFSTAFKLFKPFLDPVTVSKIFILSSSYKKELLKQIPEENLPKKFGGKSEVLEADGGLYLSDVGPWRDAKYIGPEGEAPHAFSLK